MFNHHFQIPWGSFRGQQEEKWGSFRGQFGDHFRVGNHFGVAIISGAVQSCYVENCSLAHALDIRFDFLLRRHYMLCLSQCQSDSALTRTYWTSGGTAGRNSRLPKLFLLILRAFSFLLSTILNSQAGYRCTLDPRLPFPVPRSPFPVPCSWY